MMIPQPWFDRGFSHVILYLRDHSCADYDKSYVCRDGYPLGAWTCTIRKCWKNGTLDEKMVSLLIQVGLSPSEKDIRWYSLYALARDYLEENGVLPDLTYRTSDGVMLGAWLDKQIQFLNSLSEEQQQLIKQLGE